MSNQHTQELTAFEAYLRKNYAGRTRFERRSAARLFASGGKRLRPAMTLSAARLGAYRRGNAFPAAAAVELIHTASLVHDDIVDHALIRRGVPTISGEHGNAVAVYMGDYLLAQSLIALAEAGADSPSMSRVASGIRSMCAGEIEQYLARYSVPSVTQYIKRVLRKTGLLFAASCALGGHCGGLSQGEIKALARFGMSFGAAFQIRDDILDLRAEAGEIGKPVLRDIAEGIVTLPVLLAREYEPGIGAMLEGIFAGKEGSARLADAVYKAGGFVRAEELLMRYRDKCAAELERLPDVLAREDFYAYLALLIR